MKRWFLISLLGALAVRVILWWLYKSNLNGPGAWGMWAKEYGLSGYYDYLNFFNYASPSQPPLSILIYLFSRSLYELLFGAISWLNFHISVFPSIVFTWFTNNGYGLLLNLPFFISDLLLGVIVYHFAKSQKILAMNLFLFNPFVLYDHVRTWETSAFLVLTMYFCLLSIQHKKLIIASILLACCLLIKTAAILFLPLFFWVMYKKKPTAEKIIFILIVFLSTLALFARPFAIGNTYIWLANLYQKLIMSSGLSAIDSVVFFVIPIAAAYSTKNKFTLKIFVLFSLLILIYR